MSKLIYFFILIILLITIAGCAKQNTITAEVTNTPSCPRGIENEPYPGTCPTYADANSNGNCDLSE